MNKTDQIFTCFLILVTILELSGLKHFKTSQKEVIKSQLVAARQFQELLKIPIINLLWLQYNVETLYNYLMWIA